MKTIDPSRKANAPQVPKKCIGRLPYFPTNRIEARSNPPVTSRPIPNFDRPYFLGRCSTTFSPIFLNPAHFASNGMYRCISPYTSILFTTFTLYAFSPQLKSCNFIFETRAVNQLKNLEGAVLEMGS